jgi:hypothetical protein
MKTTFRKAHLFGVLVLVLLAVGCKGTPPVHVSIEEELAATASVTVHLIGVQWVDHHMWSSKSVDEYWRPDDRLRVAAMERGAVQEMKFGPGHPVKQALMPDDPIWKKWREIEARYLFVIADIPGVRGARKLDFDVEKVRGKEILILVSRKGLEQVK